MKKVYVVDETLTTLLIIDGFDVSITSYARKSNALLREFPGIGLSSVDCIRISDKSDAFFTPYVGQSAVVVALPLGMVNPGCDWERTSQEYVAM